MKGGSNPRSLVERGARTAPVHNMSIRITNYVKHWAHNRPAGNYKLKDCRLWSKKFNCFAANVIPDLAHTPQLRFIHGA